MYDHFFYGDYTRNKTRDELVRVLKLMHQEGIHIEEFDYIIKCREEKKQCSQQTLLKITRRNFGLSGKDISEGNWLTEEITYLGDLRSLVSQLHPTIDEAVLGPMNRTDLIGVLKGTRALPVKETKPKKMILDQPAAENAKSIAAHDLVHDRDIAIDEQLRGETRNYDNQGGDRSTTSKGMGTVARKTRGASSGVIVEPKDPDRKTRHASVPARVSSRSSSKREYRSQSEQPQTNEREPWPAQNTQPIIPASGIPAATYLGYRGPQETSTHGSLDESMLDDDPPSPVSCSGIDVRSTGGGPLVGDTLDGLGSALGKLLVHSEGDRTMLREVVEKFESTHDSLLKLSDMVQQAVTTQKDYIPRTAALDEDLLGDWISIGIRSEVIVNLGVGKQISDFIKETWDT